MFDLKKKFWLVVWRTEKLFVRVLLDWKSQKQNPASLVETAQQNKGKYRKSYTRTEKKQT